MNNRYFDLIDQTFYFPQDGFDIDRENLVFNGVPIKHLIEKYGTPLKLTYLPKIGAQIKKARNLFNRAIKTSGYSGKYYYCYCTKSCHFSYVMDEVLRHGVHLETSSSFDIDLIHRLYAKKKITKSTYIINNGYKTEEYVEKVSGLINDGFKNVFPIMDNTEELDIFDKYVEGKFKIGLRVATEEEPNFEFYTSRLGIRSSKVLEYYKEKIADNPKFELKLLHFFVDTGIKDTQYYWSELRKAVKLYCELKKICPSLKAINIGGGMPIRNSLGFEFDYKYHRVNIGGLTCDNSDYYNSEVNQSQVYLPKYDPTEEKEPLYLGFFHTGAYQDALSGYGGIKHCLIPSPKHIVLYKDKEGNLVDTLYRPEQTPEEMLQVLGY